jgi:hypothetical protein
MSVPQSSSSEPTPKLGAALRQRHLQRWVPAPLWRTSLVLLSIMTLINLLTAKRQPRDSSATGYLSSIGGQAIEGGK